MSHRNHAHSAFVQCDCPIEDSPFHLIAQRFNFPFVLNICTAFQHFFHGTFGHQLCLPHSVFYDNAHSAAFKIERNLINLFVAGNKTVGTQFFLPFDNCNIYKVLQSRLKITVQKGMTQDPIVFFTFHIQMIFQDNLILCKSSCLVCA